MMQRNSPPFEAVMERNAPRRSGVPLDLVDLVIRNDTISELGVETIQVWFDETGIHFRHANGSRTEGHLPWSLAIAMSLLPPDAPRVATIEAA
jgi:hypothetical protein